VITNALVEIKYPEGVDRMDKKKKNLQREKIHLGRKATHLSPFMRTYETSGQLISKVCLESYVRER
jgi:hypothetical protein